MKKVLLAIIVLAIGFCTVQEAMAQKSSAFRIARLKYDGGGDWYNDPLEEPTLLQFVKSHTNIDVDPNYYYVDIMSDDIFTYPFLFMTGHGNIRFTDEQAGRLRQYLEDGGFLYADDDYGMDAAFKREIKKIFPGKKIVELPYSYGLYDCVYDFSHGRRRFRTGGTASCRRATGFSLATDLRFTTLRNAILRTDGIPRKSMATRNPSAWRQWNSGPTSSIGRSRTRRCKSIWQIRQIRTS